MHIESIEFRAFRGQSATHALTPATIIYGRNGSGKTTILQAIQLAILGHVPGRSKTNRDPYANATVTLKLSDGEHITRRYTVTGGSVKETIDTSLMDFDLESLSTPTLDASEYFDLGPTDAVQYIFERMDMPATHNAAGILKELDEVDFPEMDRSYLTEAKAKVAGFAREALRDGIAEGLAKLTGEKGNLSADLKYWKKRVQDTQGGLRIAAELQLRASECSAGTLAELRTQIEANRAALADAQRAAGGLGQRRMAANKPVLRRKEIATLLEKPAVDHGFEVAKHTARLAELTAARVDDSTSPGLDVLQRHVADKTGQRSAAAEVARAAEAQFHELEKQLQELDALTECPHCGAKSKGWKLRLSTSIQTDRNEADRKSVEARAALERIDAEWQQAKRDAEERRGIVEANRKTDEAIVAIRRAIERLTQEQERDQQTRASLAAELEGLGTDADGPSAEELSESSRVVQELTSEQTTLSHRLEAATRLQHEITQAAQGEQEHAKAKVFVAVLDDAKKKLKARQISTIEALFQGLIAKANYFTSGILDEPLVFRDGEIGRIMGDRFVSASDVAGFSDAERGITYVAVAAALAADSPFKIAILDEVKIDDGNTALLMRRLLEAIDAGVINQAILTHTHQRDFEREFMPTASGLNWSFIQLGGAEQ